MLPPPQGLPLQQPQQAPPPLTCARKCTIVTIQLMALATIVQAVAPLVLSIVILTSHAKLRGADTAAASAGLLGSVYTAASAMVIVVNTCRTCENCLMARLPPVQQAAAMARRALSNLVVLVLMIGLFVISVASDPSDDCLICNTCSSQGYTVRDGQCYDQTGRYSSSCQCYETDPAFNTCACYFPDQTDDCSTTPVAPDSPDGLTGYSCYAYDWQAGISGLAIGALVTLVIQLFWLAPLIIFTRLLLRWSIAALGPIMPAVQRPSQQVVPAHLQHLPVATVVVPPSGAHMYFYQSSAVVPVAYPAAQIAQPVGGSAEPPPLSPPVSGFIQPAPMSSAVPMVWQAPPPHTSNPHGPPPSVPPRSPVQPAEEEPPS